MALPNGSETTAAVSVNAVVTSSSPEGSNPPDSDLSRRIARFYDASTDPWEAVWGGESSILLFLLF